MLSLNIAGRRSEAVEYMDMPAIQGNYLDGSFRFIDFVNRYGGGHITDIGIKEAIIHLLKKSRHGLIVNDLTRSLASYAACYLLTLFVKDKVCRNDSLLSVRKGFRAGEMRALLES